MRGIVRIDGAAARWLARMRLYQRAQIVEAHEGAIRSGAQALADEARGQRVSALATCARWSRPTFGSHQYGTS